MVSKLQYAWLLWNLHIKEQIEDANYEYINWNWWPRPKIRNFRNLVTKLKCASIFIKFGMNWNWWFWPKIIDSGKFGPDTEICSDFYKIWHSQEIKDTYYEYNTSKCPESSNDFRLITWNYNTNYYSFYYTVPCSEWLEVVKLDSQSEHD